MDFNATIDLIIKDLDEARKIIDDLKLIPGVPVLQVELAKSKCKSAGEIIALLKDMNINGSSSSDVRPHSESSESDSIKSVRSEAPVSSKPVLVSEDKRTISNPPKTKHEPPVTTIEKKPEIEELDVTAVTNTDVKSTANDSVRESDSSILADKFSHLSNRFNEHIGFKKGDEDITEKLKAKPITNLSDAIGINDKFLYIREIFNNDKEAFAQAIARLEYTESMTDAIEIIMSYTKNDDENEAVSQLLSLVKRKLQTDE